MFNNDIKRVHTQLSMLTNLIQQINSSNLSIDITNATNSAQIFPNSAVLRPFALLHPSCPLHSQMMDRKLWLTQPVPP